MFINSMKKVQIRNVVLLSSIFLLISLFAKAQDVTNNKDRWITKGWNVGVNVGSNLFYGDLRVYKYWPVIKNNNERKYAGSFHLGKELTPFLEFQGNLLLGNLSGTKRIKEGLPFNQYFDAKIFEYSTTFKLDFASLLLGANEDRFFSVYTYAGIGLVNFRSQRKMLGSDIIVMSYGYDGNDKIKATTETVLPVGVGFDFLLVKNLKLNIDASIRFVNTDKLDAYVNHKTGIDDMYGYTSVGLTYTFGKKKKKEDQKVVEQSIKETIPESKVEDSVKVAVDSIITDSLVSEKVSSMASEAISKTNDSLKSDVNKIDRGTSVDDKKNVDSNQVTISESKKDSVKKQQTEQTVKSKSVVSGENTQKQESATTQSQSTKSKSTSGKFVVEYRVQVMALHENGYKKVAKLKKQNAISEPIVEEKLEGWYKYTVGSYATLDEAKKLKESLINKGKTDVFIVAYKNGRRISIAEAQSLK